MTDVSEDNQMPTYKVRPAGQPAAGKTPWGLICEQCRAVVAAVATPADLNRLSAGAALGVWPELREAVGRHELGCPGAP
jgi:hypothetical protein